MQRFPTLLFLAFFSGTIASHSEEPQPPPLGMWSWKQDAFLTEESRKDLLDFCERENIRHIDQHISIRKDKSGSYRIQNEEPLSVLLAEAAQKGITVNALRGDKAMFFANTHSRTLEQLRSLLDFNSRLPDQARFSGIKYDVEPYLSPEWKAGGDSRSTVIKDYLTGLKLLRTEIDARSPNLNLCADVPFWWDKAEFATTFGGEEKRLVHHIQDQTDWIGIMSYRRESRLVLRFVEHEIAYADSRAFAKSVAPALDTIEIKGKESFISFWGTPPDTFRKTLQEIRQQLSDSPSVRMIILHDYQSLKEYLGITRDK